MEKKNKFYLEKVQIYVRNDKLDVSDVFIIGKMTNKMIRIAQIIIYILINQKCIHKYIQYFINI